MQFITVQAIEECTVYGKVLEHFTLFTVASLGLNATCEVMTVSLYERVSLITEIGRPS